MKLNFFLLRQGLIRVASKMKSRIRTNRREREKSRDGNIRDIILKDSNSIHEKFRTRNQKLKGVRIQVVLLYKFPTNYVRSFQTS